MGALGHAARGIGGVTRRICFVVFSTEPALGLWRGRRLVHSLAIPYTFHSRTMKLNKHRLGAAGIVGAMLCLITLTWIGTLRAIHAQGQENAARVEAALANQALSFSEQINQQIVTLDQTLRILVAAYERNPSGFDLQTWRAQAVALSSLGGAMILADENGAVRQSSIAAAVNQSVTAEDYFQALAKSADPADHTFIGSTTISGILRQPHMNVARALRHTDGSFAGVIAVEYRTTAITELVRAGRPWPWRA